MNKTVSTTPLRLTQATWNQLTLTLQRCMVLTHLLSMESIDEAFDDPQIHEDVWNNLISALDGWLDGAEPLYGLLKSHYDGCSIVDSHSNSDQRLNYVLTMLHLFIGKLSTARFYIAENNSSSSALERVLS